MSLGTQMVPGGQDPKHSGNGLCSHARGTHSHCCVMSLGTQMVPGGHGPRHTGNGLCSHGTGSHPHCGSVIAKSTHI